MEMFAEELTLTPGMIETRHTQVLEIYFAVAGFYTLLARDDGSIELEHLFILPTQLRKGFGKLLFEYARDATKGSRLYSYGHTK
jgi:GNAT superfamily N-acetyltransferase